MLMDSVNTAVQKTAADAISVLPGLLIAVLVFVLGWVVSYLVSRIFSGLLKTIRMEEFLKTHKVEDALGSVRISDVLVKIVKYYVLLIFVQFAVSFIVPGAITDYLTMLLVYIPLLIAGVVIVLISIIFGEYLKEMIMEFSKSPMVKLVGRGVKVVVVYVGITMGLATANFDTTLITGIFMTVLQAVVFGVALAVGISFGLGGQDDAKEIIKSGRKNLKL